MKKLLLTLDYPPQIGGVANYYSSLVSFWPSKDSLTVVDNSQGGLAGWKKAFFSVAKKLFSQDIDYIIVGHILPLGTASYLLSYFFKFRYAVILHGLDFSLAKKKKFITKQILKRADKIICANSRTKKEVISFLGIEEKVFVVNPGISEKPYISSEERAQFLKDYGHLFNNDNFRLFSLGRLVERKGFNQVIEALKLLSLEDLRQIDYFLAGRGPEEENLKKEAEKANKIFGREVVKIIGSLSETEKYLFMEFSSVFIMPAREIAGDYEGFGIVYLEANLCHLPVIAGKSGGVSDAVQNKLSGFLVDPLSTKDISMAILRLKKNPELVYELGEKAYQRAITDFLWKNQAQKIYEIVN